MKKLFTKKNEKTNLDDIIETMEAELLLMTATDDGYEARLEALKILYDLKDKNIKSLDRVSKDTLAVVAGNLVGLLLVLNFERVGVITSKALGFVIKGRV